MVINTSSFRRYTPPTCTLEIYHPHSFWGNWGAKNFPPQFSFRLHFDDPRLPKEEKSIILGDRNLLEKLREKVNEYVEKYLAMESIWAESLTCELPLDNQEEFISISQDSAYRHRLLYQCFFPKEETLEVVLTNTQLFDFVNALSSYHYDASKPIIDNGDSISSHLGLSITITALACVLGGGIWWRYEQQISDNTIDPPSSNDIVESNVEQLIPPTPIDPKTLPEIVAPEVPDNLKNRQPLLPPPATMTKPPQNNEDNNVVTNQIETNNQQLPTSQTEMIIIPPPPAPTISNLPSVVMEEKPANVQPSLPSINSVSPSLPTPVTPSFAPSPPQYPTRLSTLPTLQASNKNNNNNIASANLQPGINTLNSISPNVIEKTPDFANQISRLDASLNQKSTAVIANDVKQYFQRKWQPPENLKQSIEYRLKFNQNGSLSKVTPVGQVAIVFLDRTGIPLLGEKITTSFSEKEEITVRLILSPNGNVQTFSESP